MPLKILHTADVHLGAKFLGLGRKGHELRSRLLQAFDDTVNLAIREKVDLLLIAGDLFDSVEVPKTLLAQVAYRLQDLSATGIPVCISPGTHDPYGESSVYKAPELDGIGGMTVFTSEEMQPAYFPELDCVVYGNANMKPFTNRRPLESLDVDDNVRWRLGMVHASFEIPDLAEDTYVVTPSEIAASGLDYLALGHIHSFSDRSSGQVTAFYPGSPEMVRMQKGDTGNVLVVELGEEETWVRPFRTGSLTYEEISLKAEEATSVGLVSVLESRADPDKVLQVNIDGLRPPGYADPSGIMEQLSDLFFFVRLTDRSVPAPSTLEPEAYPAGSPASEYLRLLGERLDGASPSETEEIREAMMLGLSLLLEEGC
jgi:DNA repair protein SbcD/Mre11